MSHTVLTVVNKVLRKLREPEVSTIDGDDGAELVLDFLNETNKEVQDAFNWRALQVKTSIAMVASQSQYAITDTPEGSDILMVYNQTNNNYLTLSQHDVEEGLKVASPTEGKPRYYNYAGRDSSGDILIDLYPVPDTTDTLVVTTKSVQGTLDEITDLNTVLKMPEYCLFLGAYAKAVAERGEDDSETFNKADAKYYRALSDSIALEDSLQGKVNSEWSNDLNTSAIGR